jgi:hypothetical protein
VALLERVAHALQRGGQLLAQVAAASHRLLTALGQLLAHRALGALLGALELLEAAENLRGGPSGPLPQIDQKPHRDPKQHRDDAEQYLDHVRNPP